MCECVLARFGRVLKRQKGIPLTQLDSPYLMFHWKGNLFTHACY